jgi:site-specific recombinase XerD
MIIRVEQGKGAKDRYTLLSSRLLAECRYWIAYRPKLWLFTGTRSRASDQRSQRAALVLRGQSTRAHPQGLWHPRVAACFATHLLEAGADIHTIHRLMGHRHISSTLRYFHLADKHLAATVLPHHNPFLAVVA